MLHAWSIWDAEADFDALLETARRALSLFQHHDGITGTARDHVVKDYARQMTEALKACKTVIQQSAYRYLTKPSVCVNLSQAVQNSLSIFLPILGISSGLYVHLFQH